MKILYFLLLLPVCGYTQNLQPVVPVESDAYIKLIRKQPAKSDSFPDNQVNSIRNSKITQNRLLNFTYFPIRQLSIRNNKLFVKKNSEKILSAGISYTIQAGIKPFNRQPALQTEYVQGRNINGVLQWQGAETNENFSFGPAINQLQFDRTDYTFDKNGKLKPLDDGGTPAVSYNNNLLRTGSRFSNSLNVQTRISKDYYNYWDLSILYYHSMEKLILPNNRNNNDNISFTLTRKTPKLQLSGTYMFNQAFCSNSNQNGFLNKMYQYSLLTPVSFSNTQNYTTDLPQKRFSATVDHPLFQLRNHSNPYRQVQHKYSVNLADNYGKLTYRISPSIEKTEENSTQSFLKGTAYFENGKLVERNRINSDFTVFSNAKYIFALGSVKSELQFNYAAHWTRASIRYFKDISDTYRYSRNTQEGNLSWNFNYYPYFHNKYIETGMQLSNKFYISGTSNKNIFLLPAANYYINIRNVLNASLDVKIAGTYSKYVNELPLNQSFAYSGVLQLFPEQANGFFAFREISGFKNLDPIRHREWNIFMEIQHKNKISFYIEYFNRFTQKDIFPVTDNNQLLLKNIADHQNKGIEIEISHNKYFIKSKKLRTGNSISLSCFRSLIKELHEGFDYLPVAGFSNIQKAMRKGESMGAIFGNSFLRDADNRVFIGNDGYPLVNNQLKKIGDALPKFVLKITNRISYHNFLLSVDWEWKHGGQVWNGTEAVLDYYGRSLTSGVQRNTENYIFNGVTTNGQTNTKAVQFFDRNQPLMQNRWTRYGYTGIAESYIQKADQLKINSLALVFNKECKTKIQQYSIGLHCNNLIIWSPYKGSDPSQLMLDQPNSSGLDFFNLPSSKYFGIQLTVKY